MKYAQNELFSWLPKKKNKNTKNKKTFVVK